MTNYSGIYVARMDAVSVTIAKTLVGINAPAGKICEIIRAWVDFSSTTSTVIDVRLKRHTAAGTSTAFTPLLLHPGDIAAGATAGINYTAEGTLGDILLRNTVNYLNGFLYLPVPEERLIVGPSGRFGIELPTAPGAAVTITAGIIWGEIG